MKKYILLFAIVGILATACDEEYLELYPTTSISENAAFSTPENANAVMFGLYDLMTNSQSMGSFTQIVNEVRGDDAFVAQALNWSRWVNDFNFTYDASFAGGWGPELHWERYYRIIENVNGALNAELPFDEDGADRYTAELKVFRAWAYYNLVNMYAKPYTMDDGSSPGIPLYDENTDLSIPVGRGTVADVYQLILDDLGPTVVNGLPALGGDNASERFTQAFGHGLAARVYLSMGDFPNALSRVNTALADAPALNTNQADYIMGFSHENMESIFTRPFNNDDYPIYWALNSFYDHPEGYGNVFVNSDLVNSYPADDIRRNWLITPLIFNLGDDDLTEFYAGYETEIYHFDGFYGTAASEALTLYDDGNGTLQAGGADFWPASGPSWIHYRPGHHSIYAKFPRMDAERGVTNGAVGYAMVTYMRTSELLLIKAECEARLGSGDPAQLLYDLQSRSSASAVMSSSTGQDLVDEILMERRLELVGEGFRVPDILRLGIPMVRPNIPGPNWSAVMSLPAYGDKLIYPIPESEIDANDALTDADQNPGY